MWINFMIPFKWYLFSNIAFIWYFILFYSEHAKKTMKKKGKRRKMDALNEYNLHSVEKEIEIENAMRSRSLPHRWNATH